AVTAALASAWKRLTSGASAQLAVRSSASCEDTVPASFAGQFETFLGIAEPADLVTAVRACWTALWSTRALRYMRAYEIDPAQSGRGARAGRGAVLDRRGGPGARAARARGRIRAWFSGRDRVGEGRAGVLDLAGAAVTCRAARCDGRCVEPPSGADGSAGGDRLVHRSGVRRPGRARPRARDAGQRRRHPGWGPGARRGAAPRCGRGGRARRQHVVSRRART